MESGYNCGNPLNPLVFPAPVVPHRVNFHDLNLYVYTVVLPRLCVDYVRKRPTL